LPRTAAFSKEHTVKSAGGNRAPVSSPHRPDLFRPGDFVRATARSRRALRGGPADAGPQEGRPRGPDDAQLSAVRYRLFWIVEGGGYCDGHELDVHAPRSGPSMA